MIGISTIYLLVILICSRISKKKKKKKKKHPEVPVLHHRGFVRLRDQMYLVEPMAGTEAGQQDYKQSSEAHCDEGLHAVYNYKHLRRKRSSCSHGNTTTFYDHGARPSGLFQLSSLVRTHSVDTFRYTLGFGAYS